jgi:hypothetical protein
MGLITRRAKSTESVNRAKALVASAMPVSGADGKAAWMARSGDDQWQRQAWYYYDAIGELRFAFNWLANAISRATLYAAEVDPETGLISDATDDVRAQAAAQAVLGGMDDRPQLQSTLALQWQVSGETFVLVVPESGQDPDRWMVLSANSVRQKGGTWSFKDPLTGVWTSIRPGRDLLIRIWSPHPDNQTHADSAMRAALPICQEIEKSSQNIIARLDSRLAGNGVMFLPQEIDFATSDGEPADAQGFMKLLAEAMEASISNPGQASAHVPIMAEIPGELLSAMNNSHVDLSTAMDSQVTDLRKDALNRLGSTLDMPREMAMGELASANHWSGWLIEESTYKIHVEPFLLKFGMALTKVWYRPALAAMGEPNPDRFVLAWDITEVIARPDDKEDVKYLLESNLVSQDWVRSKFGVPDDAIPSEEEEQKNLARVLASAAPTVLENASVAAALGFEPTTQPGPAAPVQQDSGQAADTRALPSTQDDQPDEGLVAAAELVVFDALSRAGGRLLTRQYRGQFGSTPKHELHTVIPATDDTDRLMEGSFQFVANIAHAFGREPDDVEERLRTYVLHRLRLRAPHNRDTLRDYL